MNPSRWLTADQQRVWRAYLLGARAAERAPGRRPAAVRARSAGVRDPGHAGGVARPAAADVRARRRRPPVPLPADPHHRPDGEGGPRRAGRPAPPIVAGSGPQLTDAGFEVLADGRPEPRRRGPRATSSTRSTAGGLGGARPRFAAVLGPPSPPDRRLRAGLIRSRSIGVDHADLDSPICRSGDADLSLRAAPAGSGRRPRHHQAHPRPLLHRRLALPGRAPGGRPATHGRGAG